MFPTLPSLLKHTHVHTYGCATFILVFCVPGTLTGTDTLVSLRPALPTALDRLGAGFHCPEEVTCLVCPGPAWPGTTFPSSELLV